jgi:hypothetical protein
MNNMNKKILISGILSIYLFCCLLTSNLLIQNKNNAEKTSGNEGLQINTDFPSSSGTEDWYRVWGRNDWYEQFEEMDVNNKTGDVYIIGTNFTTGPILLVKYNNTGDQEWNKTMTGEVIAGYNYGSDVVVDQSTGDVYIVGTITTTLKNDEIFVAKYLENGTQDWNITWGVNTADWGDGIALDKNGYLYVTGTTTIYATLDVVVIKYDINTQKQIWNTTWNSGADDMAKDIACGPYGDIYVTGFNYSGMGGDDEMFLTKFDENKINKWNISYGLTGYDIEGDCVAVDSNDNVYVTGDSGNGAEWAYLRKYSNLSSLQWEKTWIGPFDDGDGEDIFIDFNDNVFVAVTCADVLGLSQLRLLEYNPSGTLISEVNWRSNDFALDNVLSASAVFSNGTNNFYIAGDITDMSPIDNNFILVKNPPMTAVINGGPRGSRGDDDDDDDDGIIPGYDMYIIIAMIGLITVLVLKKQIKRRTTDF